MEPNDSPYAPPQAEVKDLEDAFHAAGDGEVVDAGFWRRAAALIIDSMLVGTIYYAIVIVGMVMVGIGGFANLDGDEPDLAAIGPLLVLVYVVYPLVSGLYYVGFESSAQQATLGKMAVGIKVTDASGRRLSRLNAFGRWASHLLCYLTLYIGYIVAGFTRRKRGLHDMVAGTLVVDRWAYTAEPQRQRRGLGAVAIVVLALGALLVLAYVGVMLAALPAYQTYVERAAGMG